MEQVENVSDGLMAYPGQLMYKREERREHNSKAYNAISLSMVKLVLFYTL